MHSTIVFFLSVMIAVPSLAADINLRGFDYSRADEIALATNGRYLTAKNLAGTLTQGLDTEHEQFRALFRWVCHNISYSHAQRQCDADDVLRTGKAVCSGYASLLQELCAHAGIECEVVNGYAKSFEEEDIGTFQKPNHAWNAVKLVGRWHLVDATWAAGHVTNGRFVREFEEFYFLTDPDEFIYRHYPAEEKWKLTTVPVDLKAYGKMPIYYEAFFKAGITPLEPASGELGNKLRYRFRSAVPVTSAHFKFEGERAFQTLEVSQNDGVYEVSVTFDRPVTGPCHLFVNQECVVGFKRK